eukprot:SAG31_NODE_21_length_34109_cov_60.598824_26_plen_390_part_00
MPRPEQRLCCLLCQLNPGVSHKLASSSSLTGDVVETTDISAWVTNATGPEADSGRALAVSSIARSLKRTGLCKVVGHGVAASLQERVYAAALQFFHQPRSVKQKFASLEKGTPGWMPQGQQSLGQTLSPEALPADLNEFLVFSTAFEGHPDAKSKDGSAAVIPTVPPDLPSLFTEYTAAMKQLNQALMRLTATALGEPEELFVPFFDPGRYTLQMRYYEPRLAGSGPPQLNQMRIGAHADSNGFTVVRLDGQPGLQVRMDDDSLAGLAGERWIDVVGAPDCLVVNTGRMIERWTGGLFKAAIHRVVANQSNGAASKERLSLAFFSSPNMDSLIKTVGPAAAAGSSYPSIVAAQLADAHYLAAYSKGVDANGRPVAPNAALELLGEKRTV